MPQQVWSAKQERQYERIKEGQLEQGASEDRAKEIAARTVNKRRAQTGQASQRSKTAVRDMAPQQRGGRRSGKRLGPGGPTKEQLYHDAQRRGIPGRSKMTKRELEKALGR
jgi:hypothetical protein